MKGAFSMLQLGLLIAGMFLLQAVLSVFQMRHFSREFVKLRRRGKVACGRRAGGFERSDFAGGQSSVCVHSRHISNLQI